MSEAITKAQPAVTVVIDEQIRKTVEAVQDPDTVPAFHNGYYTLTPDELRRAILALRPAVEPMTPLHLASVYAVIDSMGWDLDDQEKDDMVDLVRATEKRHGITAKAEDAHPPTKEAEKP